MYFNLNGDNVQESGKNWSQLHVHTVSVFEAFLPTAIVLTNAEALGACSQVFTLDLVPLAFLFSPAQALPSQVKVLLPLLPALPLQLFHGLSTYQGRRVILGRGSQLLVSLSTCIVSCSCFPGPFCCRWGHMEVTLHWCMFVIMDGQIFIPQHGGTIVGQYKPGNLSILFSINLGNAKSTSTLLSQLLG